MKLLELEPTFHRVESPGHHAEVDTLADAQGVRFWCPKCTAEAKENGDERGVHGIHVWFRDRGVSDAEEPGPARWSASGTGLQDLSLTPSILLTSGCGWHGFVTDGEVTSC